MMHFGPSFVLNWLLLTLRFRHFRRCSPTSPFSPEVDLRRYIFASVRGVSAGGPGGGGGKRRVLPEGRRGELVLLEIKAHLHGNQQKPLKINAGFAARSVLCSHYHVV